MNPHAITIAVAASLGVIALGRAAFVFVTRRPVVATILRSSVSDYQRAAEQEFGWVRNLRDWASEGNMDMDRDELVTVQYEVDGRRYRQDLDLRTRIGSNGDAAIVLWYNPRDPRRVMTSGPRQDMAIVLTAIGTAILAFSLL